MALVSIAEQFSGLRMDTLIGGPLKAACDSQVALARSTINFINDIGFEDGRTRMVDFTFNRVVRKQDPNNPTQLINADEKVDLKVPMLAIVNVPCLMVDTLDVVFDMEVKSSESSTESSNMEVGWDAKAKFNGGLFSVEVNVNGKISSHQENTRSSDNSAKYHVEVSARQSGTPEGLSRVLDIIAASVAPKPKP